MLKLNIKNQLIRKIIIHIFKWTFTFLVFIIIFRFAFTFKKAIIMVTGVLLPNVFPIYINFYFFNKYFKQRKYKQYIISLFFNIIFVGLFIEHFVFSLIVTEGNSSGIMNAIISISVTMGFMYLKSGTHQKHRLQEVAAKQLQMELNLLKSQINPHFFFNTLNNLYALSLDKSDEVPDVILKLSDLMRYVLDSSKNKTVLLTQEIEFIKNYISLEELRFTKKNDIMFDIQGSIDSIKIAPMILIPFIENSFKHGANTSIEKFFLHIGLLVDKNIINFSVENSVYKNKIKDESSSKLGQQNVKRRLELLYPEKYKLEFSNNINRYKINLRIEL